MANQQGIMNIPLDNIWLDLVGIFRPLRNFINFCEEEDSFALTPSNRLHNPDSFIVLFSSPLVLFQKNGVFRGHIIRKRHKVIVVSLLLFSFFIQCSFILLHIPGEQILPTNFIKISKMIDSFVGLYPHAVKCFRNKLFLTPVDIPIICLSLGVLMSLHCFQNTITKISLELNLRPAYNTIITGGWEIALF